MTALWSRHGLTPESASLVYKWYYKFRRFEPCAEHNLSRRARGLLEEFSFARPAAHAVQESADKTVKFLFELGDGKRVETVLIPFQGKYAVCLSSQVGCAMACTFCHTGTQGLRRGLRTEEIVGQLLGAQEWLTRYRPGDDRILNLVYMGQGEPLHNFDAVRKSAEIFISQHGLSLAGHKITVSTAGYLPGLKRWKGEMPDVNVALSLHSPFKEKRDRLIPINRKYPLEEILPLVEAIPTGRKRFVTYEYLLLKDFNDGLEDAHATAKLLRGTKAFVNLIPFNPWPGSKFERPERARIGRFREVLEAAAIPVTVRVTRGDEILAACGQLNSALT
ncbi:MAG TPA: 23S rRNA (adenine(2503)-C(2))-methyltransferase RlmN [Bdellovibrionales bacterium]|nr:23S rRNA (adenine(2503)-C(2))-methyltransferase RlmN [Bdellovibrionales bacterium]